ncbi:MAG: hypothetical protein WC845_01040 [Candidatus Staskawiczbacteria bacterium]|jgi:hypothetical protein
MFNEKLPSSEDNQEEMAVHHWDLIAHAIKRMNEEDIEPSAIPVESMIREEGDVDVDGSSGRINSFEQTDGAMVEVNRKVEEGGLSRVEDVIFHDKTGKEVFNLFSILPKDYVVLDEAKEGHDFMVPGSARIIVVTHDFLCSVNGRMIFLHELGHAYDYDEKPRSQSEMIDAMDGTAEKERERNAWKQAKEVVKIIRDKGVNFLPEGYEDSAMWEDFEEESIKQHNYREEK